MALVLIDDYFCSLSLHFVSFWRCVLSRTVSAFVFYTTARKKKLLACTNTSTQTRFPVFSGELHKDGTTTNTAHAPIIVHMPHSQLPRCTNNGTRRSHLHALQAPGGNHASSPRTHARQTTLLPRPPTHSARILVAGSTSGMAGIYRTNAAPHRQHRAPQGGPHVRKAKSARARTAQLFPTAQAE